MLDPNSRNNWLCKFCNQWTKTGITRARQCVAGGYRNAKKCSKAPEHVREEVQTFLRNKELKKKAAAMAFQHVVDDYDYEEEEDNENEKEIDNSNEWLMGKMDGENGIDEFVFDNDDLTWSVVSRAMGVNGPTYDTRKTTKSVDKGKSVASSSSSKSIGVSSSRSLIDEDDVIDGFVEDEMEEDIGEDKYDEDEEDGEWEFNDDI